MDPPGGSLIRGYWIPSLSAVQAGGPNRLRASGSGTEVRFSGPLHRWRGGWTPKPSLDGVLVPAAGADLEDLGSPESWAGQSPAERTWRIRILLAELGRRPVPGDLPPRDLGLALGWLREHLTDEAVGVDSWARCQGLHPDVLARKLRSWMGCTPVELIRWWRIDHALHLLRSGGEGRESVARACGFRSVRDWHRVFLKVTGLTPGQYRRAWMPGSPMDALRENMDKMTAGSPDDRGNSLPRIYSLEFCP